MSKHEQLSSDPLELAKKRHAALSKMFSHVKGVKTLEDQWWPTTDDSSFVFSTIYLYTYVEGHFKFPNGTRLIYSGNGLAAGLGASSVSGQLFFNVNPKELPSGDVKCFYEGLGAFGAGVHLDFWHNGKSIGNGNLYGLGIHVTTPGMTWGEIKLQ